MHEISPVLAGTYDQPDYAPAVNNIANGGANAASNVSVGSAVPKTTDAGTVDMSFSDVLDLVNPLQHIPVISSIYRAITGDTINPVSRVAGDILYGGAFGVASAVLGGIGGAADSVMEAQTGKDGIGYVVASLFGDDKTSATDTLTATAVAANTPLPTSPAALASTAPAPVVASTTPDTTANTGLITGKAFPLVRNNLPYGGVIAPAANMQEQNMAIALSEGSRSMRLGNMIYTGRMMNGPHPMPASAPAPTTASATPSMTAAATAPALTTAQAIASASPAIPPAPEAVAPSVVSTVTATASTTVSNQPVSPATTGDTAAVVTQKNPLPQNLIDDMLVLKALNQYRSIAGGSNTAGTTLNVTN